MSVLTLQALIMLEFSHVYSLHLFLTEGHVYQVFLIGTDTTMVGFAAKVTLPDTVQNEKHSLSYGQAIQMFED